MVRWVHNGGREMAAAPDDVPRERPTRVKTAGGRGTLVWLLALLPATMLPATLLPATTLSAQAVEASPLRVVAQAPPAIPRRPPARQRFRPLHLDRLGGPPRYGRLTTEDAMRVGGVLRAARRQPAQMVPMAARSDQYWIVSPVDQGLVRLHRAAGGGLWSLAAGAGGGPLRLEPSAREPRQLWRLVSYGQTVRLDSVAYPGRSLAGGADGLVTLERTSGAAAQQWYADFAPPPLPQPLPLIRLARQEVVPRAELAPAVVALKNSHRNDLVVVVGDLRPGRAPTELKIPAGGEVQVRLARDAGATLRETYELRSRLGVLEQQRYVTEIPPATLYDISVYERFLQSIAIDRTGKSPEAVEDVNYQPRSVGIFPVPAGDALPRQAQIDVWRQARAAGNPGGVRPLASREQEPQAADPLQRLLEEGGRSP